MRNKNDTGTIARLATTLEALGRASKQLRSNVIMLGAGPPGFQGDMVHLQQAADAMCRITRVERAVLTDRTANVDTKHEAQVRQDLRSHASTIKGYAELILEELAADLRIEVESETEELLDALVSKSEQLLPLIDALRSNTGEITDSAAQQEAPTAPAERVGAPRALIIDDDETTRTIVARHLQSIGLDCVFADGGRQALDELKAHAADVVLCDIMMRDTSGYEVLRQIKEDPALAATPVVMLSAIDNADSIAMCFEMGAADYITKPFHPQVLIARIQACRYSQANQAADAAEALASSQMLGGLMAGLETIADGFAIFDEHRALRACNRAFRELYPDAPAALPRNGDPAVTLGALLEANWQRGMYATRESDRFDEWSQLRVSRHDAAKPHMERLSDGRWIQFDHNRLPHGGIAVQARTVTRADREKERLWFLHFHDPVTGLPNAGLFDIQLGHSIEDGHPFVLLLLQVAGMQALVDARDDGAKPLLKRTAETLLSRVRAGDMVAHLDNERFAVFLKSVDAPDTASDLARRIGRSLHHELTRQDGGAGLAVHIGMALYPSMADNPTSLLDTAAATPVSLEAATA